MNNIHSNTTFLNEAIDKKTDVEDEKTDLILANMIDLRKTMSDVLSLLLGAKKNSRLLTSAIPHLTIFRCGSGVYRNI